MYALSKMMIRYEFCRAYITIATIRVILWSLLSSEKKDSVRTALTKNSMKTLIMNLLASMYLGCIRFMREYDMMMDENAVIISMVMAEKSS